MGGGEGGRGGDSGSGTEGQRDRGPHGGLSPCPGTAAAPAGPRSRLRTVQGTARRRRDGDVTRGPRGGVTARGGGFGDALTLLLLAARPATLQLLDAARGVGARGGAVHAGALGVRLLLRLPGVLALWGGGSWGHGDVGDVGTGVGGQGEAGWQLGTWGQRGRGARGGGVAVGDTGKWGTWGQGGRGARGGGVAVGDTGMWGMWGTGGRGVRGCRDVGTRG